MASIKPLTLRRNFSWTFIGNAVYAACQWGMLVVLAKLGNPEMVGQFTIGFAVTAPVIMFANLQLRAIQATDAQRQYLFGDYLGLRLIGIGLAVLAIAVIVLFSGYRWETSVVILLVGMAKAFESVSDVLHGLLQQHERMDRVAVSLMVKGPLSLLVLAIVIHLSGSVVWGVASLVFAWAVVFVCYDIPSAALMLKEIAKGKDTLKVQPRWHLPTLKKLTLLALPLGVVMMLSSLYLNLPRYFIESYLGERQLGVFAAIAYLMVAGNMVVSALGESASPRLAKYYAAGNTKAFRNLIVKLVIIATLLGLGAIMVALIGGRQILTLIYRSEYAEYSDLFVWLMIAGGISYISSFLGYGMTAARFFRIQMPLFVLVTITSAIGCFWLLPKFGLIGGAMALISGATVQGIFSLVVIVYALHKINRCSSANHDIS